MVIKGWCPSLYDHITQSVTILRYAVVFKRCSFGNKGPQYPLHHYTTSRNSLKRWYMKALISAFMLFMSKSNPTVWLLQHRILLVFSIFPFSEKIWKSQLQPVISTMHIYLNSLCCCHVIGWLFFFFFALTSSWTGVSNEVATSVWK